MNKISIQDLKAGLSGAIAQAEGGQTLVITRHHAAVATLGPAGPAHVRRGANVGKARLKPALTSGTRGRALKALLEDRGDR